MKLKEKIKNWIIETIELDKREYHILSELVKVSEDSFKHTERAEKDLSMSLKQTNDIVKNNREDIDILHNTIKSVVSVGADIVPNQYGERSWAVVCIEGNYNIVKFVDLHGADYRRILDFLKQYEGSRMVIDAPKFAYFEDAFKM